MTRMRSTAAALTIVLTATAACDGGTDVEEELTQVEAQALAEILTGTVVASWGQTEGPQGAPARATYQSSVDFVAPCPLGGSVAVAGDLAAEVDDETQDATIDYTLRHTHQGCVAESESGLRFTLTGAPLVTADLQLQTVGNLLSLDGDFAGGVAWSTEGKEGVCTLALDFGADLDVAQESGTASLAGTVCGVTVSSSVSVP